MVQPCIRFKEESSWYSMGQTAQSITCSNMEKPHTGLDECPRILLSCNRARNSAGRSEGGPSRISSTGPYPRRRTGPSASASCTTSPRWVQVLYRRCPQRIFELLTTTTGLSKRNGANMRESFCPAAASHSRPRQACA